jgi:cytochrome c-type biogenesis protein CcmH
MSAEPQSRRAFLATGASLAAALFAARLPAQETAGAAPDSLAGRGATGTLNSPSMAGRPRDRSTALDNDAEIQEIEKRLRCTCGCTLDVYTCRTTDFACTYSPELHKEVLALHAQGMDGDAIVEEFVRKYGEEARMAPPAKGFNLAGYLFPGTVILGLGGTLLWVLGRRRERAATEEAPTVGAVRATPEELAELERALAEEDAR